MRSSYPAPQESLLDLVCLRNLYPKIIGKLPDWPRVFLESTAQKTYTCSILPENSCTIVYNLAIRDAVNSG